MAGAEHVTEDEIRPRKATAKPSIKNIQFPDELLCSKPSKALNGQAGPRTGLSNWAKGQYARKQILAKEMRQKRSDGGQEGAR